MKRASKTIAILVGVVGFLALASYATTSITWDGGFPAGEFRINVRDPDGKPVQAAVLRVYHGGSRNLAFKYPLDNHLPGQQLVSDENGRITAIRKWGGSQFGGDAWKLFWVIPMEAQAPDYDCEITAPGFKPLKFSIRKLFVSRFATYEEFPKTELKVDGKEVELPIYEHNLLMERP